MILPHLERERQRRMGLEGALMSLSLRLTFESNRERESCKEAQKTSGET